ncbi:bifunctional metallophosphatase/5'-nucleotidase [Dysosmobacter sp.]|jgi:5'-nucleotidase/UDP-sugar diphosphatase|uniref:bifunctional metallophosphatase/5'-nucleotidase n=1 Tax=Dysosmobacter sp. TaxID=2591382 RepID=UPI002A8346C3|nr:5'-nucleotidase C-terminal domain-containing protein [Dysosmobacter sp.]MCI7214448.1 5'-nucleotidase C-terminal domain-containing protein [Dysosmobacter sp.]MDY3654017.1 5'-nucleotidase C-terminal domain-containing protein [Dysosmobacter sp.]
MKFRRFSAFFLALLLAVLCVLPVGAVAEGCTQETNVTTILFTHDLHSHFLPQPTAEGGESGGYARLKTVIDGERAMNPDALLVDGGDFSIGSLIQTLYTTQAAELRTMGAMGYDAVTIGNHEFDHKGVGFAEMLNSAKAAQTAAMGLLTDSQYPPRNLEAYQAQYGPLTLALPALLEANYAPADDNPDRAFIRSAMENYGVTDCMTLERSGVTYGLFGLMGVDSDECAPTSGFTRTDAAKAAKHCVETLKGEGAEIIVCLSHSGTGDSLASSEDEELAKAVDGIDVIVSGHTHSTLAEPLVVNDTYIVSSGPYCQNLGSLTFSWDDGGEKRLLDYRLIPIDETVAENPEIAGLVEQWKDMVGETYLARYGLTYDEVLTHTDCDLTTPASAVQENNGLGTLVSDAFLWADRTLNAAYADSPHTVSVTADGVLRANLPVGDLTAAMAFDVLSMGVGEDGTSGFPLVAVYLTGKELKAAMEVDASVTPIMPAAQLYISGAKYAFNTKRMFFNRVYDAALTDVTFDESGTGNAYEIDDNALYRVVTGMYSAQMLGTVKSKSMGLLSLEPKQANGTPVTDFADCILYDANGNELKEWYALAAYLEQFGEDGLPDRYADPANGCKQVSDSFAPGQLLAGWNGITWVVLGIVLLILTLILLLIRSLRRRIQRKKPTPVN